MVCSGGYCHTCWGVMYVVAGVAVIANFYWKFADWWLLVGVLLVLWGVMRLVKPVCPHCTEGSKAAMAARPMKKGK